MKTTLRIKEPGKPHFKLMNTINNGSSFKSFPTPGSMHTAAGQIEAARILRDGWKQNGGKSGSEFEIKHFPENGRDEDYVVKI
jgi:hypothetical protein